VAKLKLVGSDSADTSLLSPDEERTISQRTVIRGADKVTPHAEQVLDDCVSGEETLRLAWRLEPTHLSLSLPGRLVGDLRSVVAYCLVSCLTEGMVVRCAAP